MHQGVALAVSLDYENPAAAARTAAIVELLLRFKEARSWIEPRRKGGDVLALDDGPFGPAGATRICSVITSALRPARKSTSPPGDAFSALDCRIESADVGRRTLRASRRLALPAEAGAYQHLKINVCQRPARYPIPICRDGRSLMPVGRASEATHRSCSFMPCSVRSRPFSMRACENGARVFVHSDNREPSGPHR